MNFFKIKSIEQFRAEDDQSAKTLNRCLGPLDLILLGVGAIIGTGIFVLTGVTAATATGPAVVISFIISGVVCTFVALCYSELSSKIGGCGSAYGYSYAVFGQGIGFLVAWMLILEYLIATTAVSVGWSGYLINVLNNIGMPLPESLTVGYFSNPEKGIINLPASLILLILMGLLLVGVRQSATLNTVLVAIKVFAVIVFIGVAMFNIQPSNWSPFIPYGWFSTTADGHTVGIIAGASLVFFAYVGFDAVSTAAEESKNPARDVPIGIIGSLVFCTLIYIVVSGLMTGIVSYKELNVSSPASHALTQIGFKGASALVGTAVIAGLTSVMLVLYYALTRILFALSRDTLIPSFFSSVNSKTKTPTRIIIATGITMSFIAGELPFNTLVEIVNIGTLSAFIFVCLAVPVARKRYPQYISKIVIPGGLIIPILGALSCFGLILALPTHTISMFALWMLVGVLVYVLYSSRQ
ncbi:MAG: amino acid permease [Methylacidiphilales bacterium]|nr:amino acid permease [Candidatus Methylacidiphilales bacterium]